MEPDRRHPDRHGSDWGSVVCLYLEYVALEPEILKMLLMNLSMQHQFTNSTTLQVGYVGQHGTHLMVPMPYLQKQLHADGTITYPFLSGNPTLQAKLSQISGTAAVGNMRYDALQATLQRRLGNGLQGQIAYTYSKCMTDSSGYFGSWGGQTTPALPYWQYRHE